MASDGKWFFLELRVRILSLSLSLSPPDVRNLVSPMSSPFVTNAMASRARLALRTIGAASGRSSSDRYVVTCNRDNLPGTCRLPDRILRRGIGNSRGVFRNVGERERGPIRLDTATVVVYGSAWPSPVVFYVIFKRYLLQRATSPKKREKRKKICFVVTTRVYSCQAGALKKMPLLTVLLLDRARKAARERGARLRIMH